MLMEVKNHLKVMLLSTKYSLMREMLNKATFLSNIIFMILNNASFIIQWLVIYSIKDNIGGYAFKEILLLWGMASSTFGVAHFFFNRAFSLNDIITKGKLDSYLVQPKNVLLSCITSEIKSSAIGDMIYGYIMLFIYGITLKNFLLFTMFSITGGLILTSISIILSSLSFWITSSDLIVDAGNNLMVNFATYPDGIFKGLAKCLLYTLIPVGIANYIPLKVIMTFSLTNTLLVLGITAILVTISFVIFNTGLKKYSSSNLMIARI